VKIEGGGNLTGVISALVASGIPVMAHCGLRPQNIRQLGRFRLQRNEDQILADAQAAEQAGAFAIVLECVESESAARVTQAVKVPTIGIGSGAGCDGQILVLHDILGLVPGRTPRHAKAYADLKTAVVQAVSQFRDDVRSGAFPPAS
ncbi:MAG: 3-methyl-2-oxobutanoate hydroxymethyltransferase, partial [Thermoguttaceae bacterium]